jgi:hypothetical protein
MTNIRCELVKSYWSTSDMNPTTSLMTLLTRDLESRSAGSSGRRLMELLEFYCFDLREPRPLEFALSLQGDEPRDRQLLEQLLEWTATQPNFQLVALVALAPELDRIARRLGRGRPSDDTTSEVLAQATEALRWTEELVEGERRDFVLRHATSRTRSEQRRLARHNVPARSLSTDFDRADEAAEEGRLPVDLEYAVQRGVITSVERELIQATRGGEATLQGYSASVGESYDALRKRRIRAERRIRLFCDAEVVA